MNISVRHHSKPDEIPGYTDEKTRLDERDDHFDSLLHGHVILVEFRPPGSLNVFPYCLDEVEGAAFNFRCGSAYVYGLQDCHFEVHMEFRSAEYEISSSGIILVQTEHAGVGLSALVWEKEVCRGHHPPLITPVKGVELLECGWDFLESPIHVHSCYGAENSETLFSTESEDPVTHPIIHHE